MQTQYSVLGYTIDLYFHGYKVDIEIDKNGQSDSIIDYKIKDRKQKNKNLIVSLLELILTKNILIFLELSMKHLDISNNRPRKTLINKISARLLGLEFKSDNTIK